MNVAEWLPTAAGLLRAREKGIVLVLGAGGARGIAHIGVWEALRQRGIPIRAVVGTSIGAQMGSFLAAGNSPESLSQFVERLGWWNTLNVFRPNRIHGGFTSGPGTQRILERFLGTLSLESLPVPTLVVATDAETGAQVVLRAGAAVTAVRASISIPGVFTPVLLDGRILMDGAIASPLPVRTAREAFPEWPVWAVDVQPTNHTGIPGTPLRALRRSSCLLQQRVTRMELQAFPPEVLIQPVIHEHNTLAFHKTSGYVQSGRDAVHRIFHQTTGE